MHDHDESMRLVHLLRAVAVELNLWGAEFAARNHLHPTDVRALIVLLDAGRAGQSATPGLLGARLHLNSASTTALVDRLERLGHVRRVRDERDRRRVRLEVSAQAVSLGSTFFGPLIGGVVAALQPFSSAELDTVQRFLDAVNGSIAAVRQESPTTPE
jgi:DNA-binding MarR family transcriptional regulator